MMLGVPICFDPLSWGIHLFSLIHEHDQTVFCFVWWYLSEGNKINLFPAQLKPCHWSFQATRYMISSKYERIRLHESSKPGSTHHLSNIFNFTIYISYTIHTYIYNVCRQWYFLIHWYMTIMQDKTAKQNAAYFVCDALYNIHGWVQLINN